MSLDKILAQYNEAKKVKTESASNGFDLKNYFTLFFEKKLPKARKRVRLLPGNNGESPFQIYEGHSTYIDGKKRVFACLKHHNNEDCPFCEARQLLLSKEGKTEEEIKQDFEDAKKYGTRKYYIVKVIDRDKEEEGVKFWRIPHNYKGDGVFDKIVSLMDTRGVDFSDSENGSDLLIDMGRDSNGYPVVVSILDDKSSPLSDDKDLMNDWLSDERTWEDVYATKPYEYLAILVKGGEPFYDKNNNKWVNKEDIEKEQSDEEKEELNSELTIGGKEESKSEPKKEESKETVSEKTTDTKVEEKETEETTSKSENSTYFDEDEEDDLPF